MVAEVWEDVPDDEGDGADEPINCYQDECGRWVWCFSLRENTMLDRVGR